MAQRRKGFTLVEVIVVLVILAILAAIMIPAMTGWIDKAKEKRLIVACRTCVTAAQTLASEAYGKNRSVTPPNGNAVIGLADVPGTASNISLDPASAAVNILTYNDGTESVTYTRLPSPQYVSGTGIAGELSAASNWAQMNKSKYKNHDDLTKNYANEKPNALSSAQLTEIFGDLPLPGKPGDPDTPLDYYIYPMAIYTSNNDLLDIQYVTSVNPTQQGLGGKQRYSASAIIVDGKTYIYTDKYGKVGSSNYPTNNAGDYFQLVMNRDRFETTQQFVDYISTSGGHYKLAE